jgi:hypothetical protein
VFKERVGSYQIIRVLARGGMAVVYLAYQPALERHVALKRLDVTGGDATLAQRFVDEAHVVARLDHPNIVTVYDFCEQDGLPYIAMEYVSGGSLRRQIGHVALPQALGVLDDMLAALTHAASRGITHRDLKPENVLVTPRGSVKIADFGIALAHETVTRLTNTGTALGTPAYMAPEQAGGGAPPDPRTDLYSVGVMAYELLAGRLPFRSDDLPLAVLYRHVHEPVPPLRAIASEVPADLAELVEQLLAKHPAERPQRADDVRQRLEEIAVSLLGPYWRRDARLEAPDADGQLDDSVAVGAPSAAVVSAAATLPASTADAAGTGSHDSSGHRRWRLVALVGVAAVAAASLAAVIAGGRDAPVRRAKADLHRPRAAAPFSFAGGGRRQSVVGLPSWHAPRSPVHSGAVAVLGAAGAVTLLVARRPQRAARFGAAMGSGDFDRDGFADLAVGAPAARGGGRPGRPGTVTVFPGSPRGLNTDRRMVFIGPPDYLADHPQRYGAALAAGDIDHDGFTDLIVGSPRNDPFPLEDGGSGSIQLLFGGKDGLGNSRSRTLHRPRASDVEFGRLLAVADVDRDGDVDIVEAARTHSSYCAGGARGPTACRALSSGAGALALADMTGDGRPDVIEGVPDAVDSGKVAGGVRIRRGTARGPSRRSIMLTQNGPHIPGNAQNHDEFGSALAAADLDRDGFTDLLVGAPGEDLAAGRLTVVRGAPSGYAISGNRFFDQKRAVVPGKKRAGHRFAEALWLAPGVGTEQVDLIVAAPGEGHDGTLWMIRGFTTTFGASSIRRLGLAGVPGGGPTRPISLQGPSGD